MTTIKVIRSATYTSLTPGVWEAVGAPISVDEAGIGTVATITISPEIAPIVDAGLLRLGVRRGLAVVHDVPLTYNVCRDLSVTTDYASPPSVQSVPVRWRLEPGDELVVYGGSGNGCYVYVVLDVTPVYAGTITRLPPLPGDSVTPAATWAMASASSRRRWPGLRRLILGAMLVQVLVAGCATSRITVTCQVSGVGPQGQVTLQCAPSVDGQSRARGNMLLELPADLLQRQTAPRQPGDGGSGGGGGGPKLAPPVNHCLLCN